MKNIVKFIESHSDVVFEELVGDFVKYFYLILEMKLEFGGLLISRL
jgi:hypothetical protein